MSSFQSPLHLGATNLLHSSGAVPGGGDWGDRPPKTYESNFFHHEFVQFGKTLDCQLKLDCQM